MSSRKTGRQTLIAFKGFLVVLDEFLEFVTNLVSRARKPSAGPSDSVVALHFSVLWVGPPTWGESMIQRGSSPVKKRASPDWIMFCFVFFLKAHFTQFHGHTRKDVCKECQRE